jgi:hypothetical protein
MVDLLDPKKGGGLFLKRLFLNEGDVFDLSTVEFEIGE